VVFQWLPVIYGQILWEKRKKNSGVSRKNVNMIIIQLLHIFCICDTIREYGYTNNIKILRRYIFLIMGRRNGFTLVEMMIVIAIMAVISAIAIPQWNSLRQNADLKAAARDLVADIAEAKARAISERLTYAMTFDAVNAQYQISRQQDHTTNALVNVGAPKDIRRGHPVCVTAAFASNPNDRLRFNVRGTTNNGTITLENSRGSKANIKINITGRTHVTFAIK
jgi:type II secretion system protein H